MKGLSTSLRPQPGPTQRNTMCSSASASFDFASDPSRGRGPRPRSDSPNGRRPWRRAEDRGAAQAPRSTPKPPNGRDFSTNVFRADASTRRCGPDVWFDGVVPSRSAAGSNLESAAEKAGRLVVPPKDPARGPNMWPSTTPSLTTRTSDYYVWPLHAPHTVRARRAPKHVSNLRRTIARRRSRPPSIRGLNLFADVMTNARGSTTTTPPVPRGHPPIGVTVFAAHEQQSTRPLTRTPRSRECSAARSPSPWRPRRRCSNPNDGNPLVAGARDAQKLLAKAALDMAELARNSVRIFVLPAAREARCGRGGRQNAHLGPQCRYRADFRESRGATRRSLVEGDVSRTSVLGGRERVPSRCGRSCHRTDEEYFSVRDQARPVSATINRRSPAKPRRNQPPVVARRRRSCAASRCARRTSGRRPRPLWLAR